MLAYAVGCAPLVNATHQNFAPLVQAADVADRGERPRGCLLVLNGIEGPHAFHNLTLAGLASAGVEREIELYDWTTGAAPLMLVHLQSRWWQRQAVSKLQNRIVELRRLHPDAPLGIIAHSGGAGIALDAVAGLPSGVEVDEVVLLAAAISPSYPLDPVLSRCRRGVWNFRSALTDAPLLGAGTIACGTMDRQFCWSAGLVGLKEPDTAVAAKFYDIAYSPRRLANLDFGGHYGGLNFLTARNLLAPIFMQASSP